MFLFLVTSFSLPGKQHLPAPHLAPRRSGSLPRQSTPVLPTPAPEPSRGVPLGAGQALGQPGRARRAQPRALPLCGVPGRGGRGAGAARSRPAAPRRESGRRERVWPESAGPGTRTGTGLCPDGPGVSPDRRLPSLFPQPPLPPCPLCPAASPGHRAAGPGGTRGAAAPATSLGSGAAPAAGDEPKAPPHLDPRWEPEPFPAPGPPEAETHGRSVLFPLFLPSALPHRCHPRPRGSLSTQGGRWVSCHPCEGIRGHRYVPGLAEPWPGAE